MTATEYFILRKGREYFQTKYCMLTGGEAKAKYSTSPYDARKYDRERDAYAEAIKQDAEIVIFTPLTGTLKETTPIAKRKCGTCYYWAAYSGACCNGSSEYRADFKLSDEGYGEWREKHDKSDLRAERQSKRIRGLCD